MADRLTKKSLREVAGPLAKAAARYANDYLLNLPRTIPAGVVASHYDKTPPVGGTVDWAGFTLEASMSRRPRIVCGVPTPYSLYTFNYCLKRDGEQWAHGATLPEFVDAAFNAMRRRGHI